MDWLLLISGLLIRGIAIWQMRLNNVWKITNPKRFVQNGIYGLVRHPMYSGGILMAAGATHLTTSNWGFTAIFTVFVFSFCVDRIDREEELMVKFFGVKYRDYMNKTGSLIPRIPWLNAIFGKI